MVLRVLTHFSVFTVVVDNSISLHMPSYKI